MSNLIFLENLVIEAIYDVDREGFVSLKSSYDHYKTNFVLTPDEFPEYDVEDCKWLGNLEGEIQLPVGDIIPFSTGQMKGRKDAVFRNNSLFVSYPEMEYQRGLLGFSMEMQFQLNDHAMEWSVVFTNVCGETITFTDINLPLLMNQYFRNNDEFKYDCCVMRHTCITGHSSYLYWEKPSGNGPVLLLAPLGDSVFVDLRQEQENKLFGSRFGESSGYKGMVRVYAANDKNPIDIEPGEKKELKFCFAFLEKKEQIDDKLASLSLMTLKAVPGMVGPIHEKFYVMTRPVEAGVSVYAPEDKILESGVQNGWRVSVIRFGAYGRRQVTVSMGEHSAVYCFFVTEAVEDMIDQHARFISENHLETEESDPCYHALLIWDMVNKRRINSTFNPYCEDWWSGGSDDPGLASGLFLAEKNVYRPSEEEIDVLNAYVEDFILQRLTEQPGWRVHRMVPWYTMFEPWAGRGADDVWRAYNYVHVINVMYDMYRIQKQNRFAGLREAVEYLKMAYEYTKAMFSYWMFPRGVGASEFGNMGEMTLPLFLAQALESEELVQEAAHMSALFDKKAHYFHSKQFPFGSEMAYDSTAFEAVYAYGKRIGSSHMMESAARASYSNRGSQPVWFLYHTDVRAGGDTSWNSSYMTQLGAWPITDYVFEQGHLEEEWILSSYGAYLSGWLIYNSGGYWSAEKENRGATGWITTMSLIDHTGQPPKPDEQPCSAKLGMPHSKGCVALSGEAGIGFFGALRMAYSAVIDHSVLGRIGLGCSVEGGEETEVIVPHDGLSMRFYHVPERWKIETEGGYINEIRKTESGICLTATVLCKTGIQITLFSIPGKEGEKPKMLFRERVDAEKGSRIQKKIHIAAMLPDVL